MLWLVGKQSGAPGCDARKKLVLAACGCARLALPLVRKGEDRPRIAIETAEAWARDEGPTIEQVRKDADAAPATYVYAISDAASAHAAAYVYATYAAAAAADAYSAKRLEVLKQCADIVRQHYPSAPRLK